MNKAIDNTKIKTAPVADQSVSATTTVQTSSRVNNIGQLLRSSRLIQILFGVLAMQLVVALVLTMQSKRGGDFATGEPLLSLTADAVGKIEITDGDENVVLSRQADEWIIEADSKLPVKTSRIDTLLESLSTMKTGLPVANSLNSREQLEVADDSFQRRITISSDDSDSVTLLVGTSPGLRKAHIRREGSDDIYSATLSIYDAPAALNQWLDKSLLAVAGVKSFQAGELGFKLDGEGDSASWVVDKPTDETRQPDQDVINNAVQALQDLQVTGFVTDDPQTDGEAASVKVSAESGELMLTLSKADQQFLLSRDDVQGSFTITEPVYEKLLSLSTAESFLPAQDTPAETAENEVQVEDEAEVKTEAQSTGAGSPGAAEVATE